MAIITLDLGSAQQTSRIVDATASRFGYQATIDGLPNPQTKSVFAKQAVINFVKTAVREQEVDIATDAARQTSIQNELTIS